MYYGRLRIALGLCSRVVAASSRGIVWCTSSCFYTCLRNEAQDEFNTDSFYNESILVFVTLLHPSMAGGLMG